MACYEPDKFCIACGKRFTAYTYNDYSCNECKDKESYIEKEKIESANYKRY
jgi:hypothetical protein